MLARWRSASAALPDGATVAALVVLNALGEAVDPEETDVVARAPVERQVGEVQFMTVAEVASLMRVSKMTVYRLVHGGDLPAVRVGRSFRVSENDVNEYLKNSFFQAT